MDNSILQDLVDKLPEDMLPKEIIESYVQLLKNVADLEVELNKAVEDCLDIGEEVEHLGDKVAELQLEVDELKEQLQEAETSPMGRSTGLVGDPQ